MGTIEKLWFLKETGVLASTKVPYSVDWVKERNPTIAKLKVRNRAIIRRKCVDEVCFRFTFIWGFSLKYSTDNTKRNS